MSSPVNGFLRRTGVGLRWEPDSIKSKLMVIGPFLSDVGEPSGKVDGVAAAAGVAREESDGWVDDVVGAVFREHPVLRGMARTAGMSIPRSRAVRRMALSLSAGLGGVHADSF